jgi:hypothetical protein
MAIGMLPEKEQFEDVVQEMDHSSHRDGHVHGKEEKKSREK